MKKILVLFSIFLLSGCEELTTVDCGENEIKNGVCIDQTSPVFSGTDDISIEIGSQFDPLLGVSAVDDVDGDVSHLITIENYVDVSYPGTYIVKYFVSDESENQTITIRYVTVSGLTQINTNLVFNGSFEYGLDGYNIYIQEGVQSNISVINNELVVDIEVLNNDVWYSPRIDFAGLLFEQGEYYKISFDAKATNDKTIQVLIGELLPAEPWYYDIASSIDKVHSLTTEYQTIEQVFYMDKPTNANGSFIIEMGDIGTYSEQNTLYIDNIIVERITEEEYTMFSVLEAPGRIEAEDYDTMQGVQVESTGDITGNQNVGWISEGDYMTYNIYVVEEGDYLIFHRVATPQSNIELDMYIDNQYIYTINVANTGDWQVYQTTASSIIHLEAGVHEFRITTQTGGFNINYFDIEKVN